MQNLMTAQTAQQAHAASEVKAVGVYLPEQRVSSKELFCEFHSESNYGIAIDWMDETTGILERRVSDSDCLPSQLAIYSAERALAQFSPHDMDCIDMVIFCGIERDNPEPATAHKIQRALGIQASYVFDLSNACFGFIEGINIATKFIDTGDVRLALIVTGEIPSRVMRFVVEKLKRGNEKQGFKELVGALTVGDAGGAVVLGPSDNHQAGFRAFNSRVDSRFVDQCAYQHTEDGGYEGHMHMARIVARGVAMHKNMLADTLKKLNWNGFDWLLSHQTGKRSFELFSQLNNIETSKMIKTYDTLGNIATATFPVAFDKLMRSGQVNAGDRVGGCFAGSGLATGQFGYIT